MSASDRSLYQVRDAHFSYKMGALRVLALSGIALDTGRGDFVSLSGLSPPRVSSSNVVVVRSAKQEEEQCKTNPETGARTGFCVFASHREGRSMV
jgi:hypothetical protein